VLSLNVVAYNWRQWDGYGRYATRLVKAFLKAGVAVHPLINECAHMPEWMQEGLGIDWNKLTISCLPAYFLTKVPGRHWLYSMTEGSELPEGWAEAIHKSNVERIIVPCEHNARAFAVAGLPVHVIHGGTDPDEFPVITERPDRPFTFLALADRGQRKGWTEVWQAFYLAFGNPAQTPDVRLIIKARPNGNDLLSSIAQASNPDPRITFLFDDMADMADLYRQADCFAIPSRSEGWGMPHREAAMMGLPVITQAHSGMDDGHIRDWATFVCIQGKLEPIPTAFEHIAGQWMLASVSELALFMKLCYRGPETVAVAAQKGAHWLREYQTWDHSAGKLLNLIREIG
jgi:glycosyltransferase involved in cell wall biosynthesis